MSADETPDQVIASARKRAASLRDLSDKIALAIDAAKITHQANVAQAAVLNAAGLPTLTSPQDYLDANRANFEQLLVSGTTTGPGTPPQGIAFRAIDVVTRAPIPGARIEVPLPGALSQRVNARLTGADGTAFFPLTDPDTYAYTVTKDGYRDSAGTQRWDSGVAGVLVIMVPAPPGAVAAAAAAAAAPPAATHTWITGADGFIPQGSLITCVGCAFNVTLGIPTDVNYPLAIFVNKRVGEVESPIPGATVKVTPDFTGRIFLTIDITAPGYKPHHEDRHPFGAVMGFVLEPA